MVGFDKIEFGSEKVVKASMADQKDQVSPMVKQRKKTKFSLKFSKKALPALGIVVVLLVLVAFPAFATYKSGLKTYRDIKLVSAALKTQDIALASEQIAKTKKDLQETQRNFHYLLPLKFIPLINFYYNDADHLMQAGVHGLDTTTTAIDALKPYADILGLKGAGSFTGGTAENRIQTAVMAASKITPQIDKIGVSLELLNKEMKQVDPNHYPTLIFGKKIKTQLTEFKDLANAAATSITDAKPLVKALPSLLGESESKKYLILFQNDKELRPTGGFITAYAIFQVDKGVIKIERSDDIYKLDDSIGGKPSAPAPLQNYLKVYTLNLRDSNISPDFIESMKTFNSLYNKSGQRVDVDGIIALDTDVLVKTIKILDDQVTAGGMTFNTKNDPRCDCPQVIYELENNISRPVNYIKTDRKSLIGELLQNILIKALSSSPKVYWGPLFQTLIAETGQKHVLFDLYDKDAQSGIEALNAAGRIKNFDGDYLHINEANLSGAKVNLFMEETVDNNYETKDGSILKTVTIHYKNTHEASDCNLERGGLCLNAEYRDWIRVYVPKGSELIESQGAVGKLTSSEDLGKTVFEGLMSVRTQGVATLTIKYKLPASLNKSPLPLLIQKQPGTSGFTYNIMVNGHTRETFQLLTDKETQVRR
ncbi:DUF4012 domain-containing protein [Candidatus Roizmanbacteria bacterium]|nr:DUF4012 domain-containing protein [Candidatus Roizmanbacteria bacterium]